MQALPDNQCFRIAFIVQTPLFATFAGLLLQSASTRVILESSIPHSAAGSKDSGHRAGAESPPEDEYSSAAIPHRVERKFSRDAAVEFGSGENIQVNTRAVRADNR